MRRKVLAMVLSAVMTAGVLAGCGNSSAEKSTADTKGTDSKEATYTRGTVFAKSAKDGKLYILGSTAASGDTLTADCILTDDVTVPATGDATTTVYLAGCFNPDKLVVKDEYTMTEADKSALRMNGIAVLPVTEM